MSLPNLCVLKYIVWFHLVSLIWLPLCRYCQHHQRKTTWTTFVTQVAFMVIHLRTASNVWKSLPYAHMFLNKTSIPRIQMIVTFKGVYRFALKGICWFWICRAVASSGTRYHIEIHSRKLHRGKESKSFKREGMLENIKSWFIFLKLSLDDLRN